MCNFSILFEVFCNFFSEQCVISRFFSRDFFPYDATCQLPFPSRAPFLRVLPCITCQNLFEAPICLFAAATCSLCMLPCVATRPSPFVTTCASPNLSLHATWMHTRAPRSHHMSCPKAAMCRARKIITAHTLAEN